MTISLADVPPPDPRIDAALRVATVLVHRRQAEHLSIAWSTPAVPVRVPVVLLREAARGLGAALLGASGITIRALEIGAYPVRLCVEWRCAHCHRYLDMAGPPVDLWGDRRYF